MAISLNDVSTYLSALHKHNEALDLTQQALIIRQKLLGDTHPDSILSLHNVIRCLKNAGRKTEAIQHFHVQFQRLKPGDPHYQYFLELRADLYPGFRKPTQKSGKGKKGR
ncbi:tetratricopeptide repeat protein [Methylobacter svalbardensis]|uniref:tetratricopeptide repeat protein n=1 Tax=Methylobacter svalbardensis TaxID=3080016 RepID=UPI0030EC81BD